MFPKGGWLVARVPGSGVGVLRRRVRHVSEVCRRPVDFGAARPGVLSPRWHLSMLTARGSLKGVLTGVPAFQGAWLTPRSMFVLQVRVSSSGFLLACGLSGHEI